MKTFVWIYKGIRTIKNKIINYSDQLITKIIFKGNNVEYKDFRTRGIPYVMVSKDAKAMIIGCSFAMNNGIKHNPIGMPQKCTFFVDRKCSIIIGNNVGISQSALIAHDNIYIGNNVKIGGGSCIYTTDFHSLDPKVRASNNDTKARITAPVVIEDNVFIGARCIILKNVTIGENSIIGAGSVVTKSIPKNQIWAGNPARFIRNIL